MSDRYTTVKYLIEQCENDEQIQRTLRAINALYVEDDAEAVNSTQPTKRKYKRRAAEPKLLDWPRKGIQKCGGRATTKQIWDFMNEQGVDYLLPPDLEEESIRRFLNKNVNRVYRKYPDGSWGFCQPVSSK